MTSLITCQPLLLTLSPSLLSNNLTTPLCYTHNDSIVLLPAQLHSTNVPITADKLLSSTPKPQEYTLSLKWQILSFDCIHSSVDKSNADYIALALENGLSVWERPSQRIIYSYEFPNDNKCANCVVCVPMGTDTKKAPLFWYIVTATSEGCLAFQLRDNRVEKLENALSCFSQDETTQSITQLAVSHAFPGHVWISDAFGRIQLYDLEQKKEAGVNIGAYAYYGGSSQGFQLSRQTNGLLGFETSTDVLSARPEEVLGFALVCAYMSGVIRLFSIKTGRLLASINAHAAPIRALALRPVEEGDQSDKCMIASASEDQNILIWQIALDENVQKIASVQMVHQQYVKDAQLTGVTWLNERTIGAVAFEKKFLPLFKLP